jgi:hypothetical protein
MQNELRAAGTFFARTLLGIIFIMQGYGKVFKFTLPKVYDMFFKDFEKYALYLLAIDLLVVSFGHGLMEPIWDLSHVIPRAILLISLFVFPPEWDIWNIDTLIKNKR